MAQSWYRWPTHHPSGLPLNKWIITRDPHCQIRLPGCTHTPSCPGCSTVADHILPPRHGGMWFDEQNLRGACQPCNQARRRTTPSPHTSTYHPEHW